MVRVIAAGLLLLPFATPASTRTVVISGKVIRAATGAPIPAAVVMAFTICDETAQRRQLGSKAITKEDGIFSLRFEADLAGVCIWGTDGITKKSTWRSIDTERIEGVVIQMALAKTLESTVGFIEYFNALGEDPDARRLALRSLETEKIEIRTAYSKDPTIRKLLKASCDAGACSEYLKGAFADWDRRIDGKKDINLQYDYVNDKPPK
jgi:hypothetical protein